MPIAVKFDTYGDAHVLKLVEVDDPKPSANEVKVAVVAAGINPGEIGIREGVMAETFPADFPEGQGSDFAGLVAAVGEGVSGVSVGDEVIGFSDGRDAQAEFVVVDAGRVVPKPEGLDWRQAGGLYVVGTTAWACLDAVELRSGDTVVIAGAAGGVGILATQLAVERGATVVATASEDHHDDLRAVGAIPVAYGDGMVERIREAAPDGVDAFIDAHGAGNVEAAIELGVQPERINTIIDFAAAEQHGTKAEGQAAVRNPAEVMRKLANLMARGKLELPVYASYPLREVREAYERLEQGHGFGKIVLDVRPLG